MRKRYYGGTSAPPTRFFQAPNQGLTIANGFASGLNQAMQNYQKGVQMNIQRQYMQMRANALQQRANYQQTMAELARKNAQDADISKLNLLASMRKHGDGTADPGLVKKFEGQYLDRVLQNMTPDEAKAATQRISSMSDKGQVAPEFQQYMNLNKKEVQANDTAIRSEATNQHAETLAGARIKAANISATAAGQRQSSALDAKTKLALGTQYESLFKDAQAKVLNAAKSSGAPLSQDQIDQTRSQGMQLMQHYDEQYRSVTGKSLMPKTFTDKADAEANALPGDIVKSPKGDHFMAPDKTWHPVQPQGQPDQATPGPQPSPSVNTSMAPMPGAAAIADNEDDEDDQEDQQLAGISQGNDDESDET